MSKHRRHRVHTRGRTRGLRMVKRIRRWKARRRAARQAQQR